MTVETTRAKLNEKNIPHITLPVNHINSLPVLKKLLEVSESIGCSGNYLQELKSKIAEFEIWIQKNKKEVFIPDELL